MLHKQEVYGLEIATAGTTELQPELYLTAADAVADGVKAKNENKAVLGYQVVRLRYVGPWRAPKAEKE